MTIDRYLKLRLGAGPTSAMVRNMFTRAFTAPTLAAFWRYWNPGYGYYLLVYCYRPLRRVLPHPAALLVTFLLCGFLLHDVFYLLPLLVAGEPSLPIPFVTCWFFFIAVGIALSERIGADFRGVPGWGRAVFHATYLGATFGLALFVSVSA